ncbi:hypothetical protein GGS21DRAFT_507796, partial [Xylaria nigripes]
MAESKGSPTVNTSTNSTMAGNTNRQGIADGEKATEAIKSNKERSFPKFMMLPAELRSQIYQEAASESMNNVQTIGISHSRDNRDVNFVIYTRRKLHNIGGIPHACCESKAEVERLCDTFSTCVVTDIGANILNLNHGTRRRPLQSYPLCNRPCHRDSTYYMSADTVLKTFRSLHTHDLVPEKLKWLRNLLIDRRTFLLLMTETLSFSQDRPEAPFTNLPSLRKIVVGCASRFLDIAVAEGRYDDVVTEVTVTKTQETELDTGKYSVIPAGLDPVVDLS